MNTGELLVMRLCGEGIHPRWTAQQAQNLTTIFN